MSALTLRLLDEKHNRLKTLALERQPSCVQARLYSFLNSPPQDLRPAAGGIID